uniref:Adenosine receptor B1a n=1 Tax=Eptatretus burgeri TaxID=7764 RepID=A0A8C4NFM5_EPTBU
MVPADIVTHLGLPKHSFIPCVLMLSSIVVFHLSTTFSLLGVAIERYIAIFNPFRYQILVTRRNALITIFITWTLSFIIGLMPVMGWNKGPTIDGSCVFELIIDMGFRVYFIFFGCVVTPLLIMFVIYARIFMEVQRQLQKFADGGKGTARDHQVQVMKKEIKTATSLFLVLFLFIVCCIPIQIMNCVFLFCPTCSVSLILVSVSLVLFHANSVVNPFLYAFRMRSFRCAFINILRCQNNDTNK